MKVIGIAADSTLGRENRACQKFDIILLEINPDWDLNKMLFPKYWKHQSDQDYPAERHRRNTALFIGGPRGGTAKSSRDLTNLAIHQDNKKVFERLVRVDRFKTAHFDIRFHARICLEIRSLKPNTSASSTPVNVIVMGPKNKQIAAELCISKVSVRHR